MDVYYQPVKLKHAGTPKDTSRKLQEKKYWMQKKHRPLTKEAGKSFITE